MGYSETPFCYYGAVIYDSDFDGKKLLEFLLKNCREEALIIKKIMKYDENKIVDEETKSILEDVCYSDEVQTIADAVKELENTLPHDVVCECCMDNEDFVVRRFDSGENIVFSTDKRVDDDISFCYFIILREPLAWKNDHPAGRRIEKKIIKTLKKRTSGFLRDNIDWSKRLGVLMGIYRS